MIFLYMFIPYVDIFLIFETHKRKNIKTFYFNQSLANKVCVLYSEMWLFLYLSLLCYVAIQIYVTFIFKNTRNLSLKWTIFILFLQPFVWPFCWTFLLLKTNWLTYKETKREEEICGTLPTSNLSYFEHITRKTFFVMFLNFLI